MNNEDYGKTSYHSPLCRSEVYSLGIALNSECSSIFKLLLNRNQNMRNRRIICNFIQQSNNEIQVLGKRQKYELNCECNRFYQSGGLLMDSDTITDSLDHKIPVISRKINRLFYRLNLLKALLDDYKAVCLFDISEAEKTLPFCMSLRHDLSNLYVSLSDIYPDGEIQKAYYDLTAIVNTTNQCMEIPVDFYDSDCDLITANYHPIAVST